MPSLSLVSSSAIYIKPRIKFQVLSIWTPFPTLITLPYLGSGVRTSPERKPFQGPLDISGKLFCSTCDQTFQNHQEQVKHQVQN